MVKKGKKYICEFGSTEFEILELIMNNINPTLKSQIEPKKLTELKEKVRNYKLAQAFFYEEKYKNSLNMIVKSNLLMNTGLFQKIER